MSTTLSLPQIDLSTLRIASPCSALWEDMTGDDKRRLCADCGLHVHNLAAMTANEAQALLAAHRDGERLCMQIYRRADGTVITRDCPVGLAKARAALRKTIARAAAAVGFASLAATLSASTSPRAGVPRLRWMQPISWVADKLNPRPTLSPAAMGKVSVRGDVAWTPPPATTTPPMPPVPKLGEVQVRR